MTTKTTATTITLTKTVFDTLTNAEKVKFYQQNGEIIETDIEEESDIEEEFDMETEEETEEVNKYDLEGPSIFANIVVNIGDKTFRLQGVKLTQKNMCMDGWDKESKSWKTEHIDTMSVINMIKTHGSVLFNEHSECVITFQQQGEKSKETIDPLAGILGLANAETETTPLTAMQRKLREAELYSVVHNFSVSGVMTPEMDKFTPAEIARVRAELELEVETQEAEAEASLKRKLSTIPVEDEVSPFAEDEDEVEHEEFLAWRAAKAKK